MREERPPILDAVARFRMTRAERKTLQAQADGAGLTLSSYVRRRVLGHTVVPAVDAQMINELRRTGGLLKHTHNVTQGAHREATAAALDDVRAAIRAIRERAERGSGGRNDKPQ